MHDPKDLKAEIDAIFQRRKSRAEHPTGKFDKQSRWYPDAAEHQECCDRVRKPSAAWPYSLMVHCRTKKHIARLVLSRHIETCQLCRVTERLTAKPVTLDTMPEARPYAETI
jgi:hypothetical protein